MNVIANLINNKVVSLQYVPDLEYVKLLEGQIVVDTNMYPYNLLEYAYIDGSFIHVGNAPLYYTWSGTSWVYDAELHKNVKNAAIDAARDEANQSPFMFQGYRVALDAKSKSAIMEAHGDWLTGQPPVGWPGGWKTMDKTSNGEPVYLDIPDFASWLEFYRAMVARGTANFTHSQALKAQLALASTPEEVDNVPNW